MAETTVKSTDHEEIREWVERQGGKPARVKGTGGDGDAGMLRIDFDKLDEGLEPISWDQFFEKFDEQELALLHSTEDASRFNKLIHR